MKKIIFSIVALFSIFILAACAKTTTVKNENNKIETVRIITTGWINTPVRAENDPFLAYVREKYGINLVLESYDGSNFESQFNVA